MTIWVIELDTANSNPLKPKCLPSRILKYQREKKRAFLGLAGYCRRFVPHYADIAAPLTDLTGKLHPDKLQREEQHQAAFSVLKEKLKKDTVVTGPDSSMKDSGGRLMHWALRLQPYITNSFTGQGRTMGMRMGCPDRPGSPIKKKQRIRTSCWGRSVGILLTQKSSNKRTEQKLKDIDNITEENMFDWL